jgi:hypothetical protein
MSNPKVMQTWALSMHDKLLIAKGLAKATAERPDACATMADLLYEAAALLGSLAQAHERDAAQSRVMATRIQEQLP